VCRRIPPSTCRGKDQTICRGAPWGNNRTYVLLDDILGCVPSSGQVTLVAGIRFIDDRSIDDCVVSFIGIGRISKKIELVKDVGVN
jgi:hypothetical protein